MPPRRQSMLVLGLFAMSVSAAGISAGSAGAVQHASTVAPARELTADEQIAHVLSRLAFGARPGDADRVRAMGVDRWVARQLDPGRIDDSETERLLARFETLRMTSAELFRDYPPPGVVRAVARRDSMQRAANPSMADTMRLVQEARRANQFVAELTAAKVARAVMSERQLQEVMVDFWSNHFSVFAGKGQTRWFLTAYDRDVIRPNAMGRFRDLLGAVARSPAMLFYLDNAQSVADSGRRTLGNSDAGPRNRRRGAVATAQRRPRGLNENYARELMELHTLGVDGGYTQKDVVEVARALTGWSIRPARPLVALAANDPRARRAARLAQDGEPGTFLFRPEVHDAEEKVVLGRRLKAGRGIADGEEVLDILARHPSTATFIARKLAVRFVSDSPPPALVDRAAATFRRTDGDIREVVRTIVTSPEFYSRAAFRAKVKSPFEVVVSTLRAMNAIPDASPRAAQLVARLGQPIYGHQAPNGWPETGEAWMNTGAILNRINFGMLVAANRVPGVRLGQWPEAARLRGASRAEQVDGVVAALLGGQVSPQTRAILVSGEHPLMAQAEADSSARLVDEADRDPPGMMNDSAGGGLGDRRRARPLPNVGELTGLAQVVGLALGSPEFQRK